MWSQPISNTYVLSFLYLILSLETNFLLLVRAEKEQQDDDENDGGTDSDEEYERFILIILSAVFAYCVSFFGSLTFYLFLVDNNIMKKYRNEGTFIEGNIESCVFAREGGDQKEYMVSVEYNRTLTSVYNITVQKNFRVLESDFYNPDSLESKTKHNKVIGKEGEAVQIEDPESLIIASRIPIDQSGLNCLYQNRRLDLMVLEEYPLSGIPIKDLERKRTCQHRITSLASFFFSVLVCMFCYLFCYHEIIGDANDELRREEWIVVWASIALIVIQIPSIHCLFGWKFQAMLEDNYFRTGQIGTVGQDDSTISTAGTRTILSRNLWGIPKSFSNISASTRDENNSYLRMGAL